MIVTSTKRDTVGSHEHVRVWNRGGLAGTLIVSDGDGAEIAERLECNVRKMREELAEQAEHVDEAIGTIERMTVDERSAQESLQRFDAVCTKQYDEVCELKRELEGLRELKDQLIAWRREIGDQTRWSEAARAIQPNISLARALDRYVDGP